MKTLLSRNNLLILSLLILCSCSKKEEIKEQTPVPLTAEMKQIMDEKMKVQMSPPKKIEPIKHAPVKANSKDTPDTLVESLRRSLYGFPLKEQQEKLKRIIDNNPQLTQYRGLEEKVLKSLKENKPLEAEKPPAPLINTLLGRLKNMDTEQRAKEIENLRTKTNLFKRYPTLENILKGNKKE